MTEGNTNRHCINCMLIHETDKAWLITPDGDKEIWVPKSQGELYRREDGTYDYFGEEWLLKKKGLI